MIVYILAIPVFSFLIPLYAFWHFDDFSWGNTRIVVGEKGQKKAVGPEEGIFDPESIPTKCWSEHEQDLTEEWEKETNCSKHSKESECSCEKHEEHEQEQERSHTHSHSHTHSRCSSASSSPTHSHYDDDEEEEEDKDVACSLYSKCSTSNLQHHPQQHSAGSILSHNPSYNYASSRRSVPRVGSIVGGGSSIHTEPFNSVQSFTRAPSVAGSHSFFAIPSDTVIIQEIERILDHNDLMQLTKKQVRDTLSDIFGMDMNCKKDFINKSIDQSLSLRL